MLSAASSPKMNVLSAASSPKKAWFTPRETGPGGDSLRRTGLDVLAAGNSPRTPRAAAPTYGAPSSFVRADPGPGIAPAGKAGELAMAGGIESRIGLQTDVIVPTPKSPPTMSPAQKRHRHKGPAGVIEMNWGLKNLEIPDPIEGYGCKNAKGEDVAQNFRTGKLFGVAEYINARNEDVYKSIKTEPLGAVFNRGHVLPDATRDPRFMFGVASEHSDHTAKDCIFPVNMAPDSEEVRLQYQKSHGSTNAGEGVNRKYVWPEEIGSPVHRFGVANNVREGGTRLALSMDCGDETFSVPKTVVVKDALANFLKVKGDKVAKPRHQLQGESHHKLPKGHCFGKACPRDSCSAGECVNGNYALEDIMPDADVGRCQIRGRRNFETDRALGVPTVRMDIPAPPEEKRSIANSVNFGDDFGAGILVRPTRFQHMGVNPQDFAKRREPSELRALLEGAGAGGRMEASELDGIIEDAADLFNDGDKRASLEAIMHVIRVNTLNDP